MRIDKNDAYKIQFHSNKIASFFFIFKVYISGNINKQEIGCVFENS